MNTAVDTTQKEQQSTAEDRQASVRRYRAKHRRFDYVPSPAVVAIIEAWRARGLNNCVCGAIDDLVIAGDKAMSGNLVKGERSHDERGRNEAQQQGQHTA